MKMVNLILANGEKIAKFVKINYFQNYLLYGRWFDQMAMADTLCMLFLIPGAPVVFQWPCMQARL